MVIAELGLQVPSALQNESVWGESSKWNRNRHSRCVHTCQSCQQGAVHVQPHTASWILLTPGATDVLGAR